MLRASGTLLCFALALLLAPPAVAGEEETAHRLNEEGIALLKDGEYAEAVEKFRRARGLLPSAAVLRRNLAAALSSSGVALSKADRLEGAVALLREAVSLEPEVALYRTNLGTVLFRLGRLQPGREELEKSVGLDPKAVSARVALGRILYRQGELEGAIRHWGIAIRLDPGPGDVAGELAKARREYEAERNHTKESSAHFEISWDGSKDRSVGARVRTLLEDAYREVGRELKIFPKEPVRVILYGEREFRLVTGAQSWVGGLFDGSIRIPVRNFLTAEREIRDKVYHEYTHVVVRSVTDRCPVWLNEGLAQVYEGKDSRPARMRVLKARRRNGLLGISELASPYARMPDADRARLAYAQALLLTRFILDEHGPEPVRRFLVGLGEGAAMKEAAESAFRRSLVEIERAWREGL